MLLTLHHIVTDGWSSGVLWRELSALYAAHCRGEPSPLPALPVQYADYAVWQREWLQGEVLEQQLAYWKPALAGAAGARAADGSAAAAVRELPRRRIRVRRRRRARRSALRQLGRREGATLFMTLLAAFQVLLYRYSGQEDIAVGVPIAGRTRPELEGLIGFFVNTLVLRGDLSGDPSFTRVSGARAPRRARGVRAPGPAVRAARRGAAPKRDLSRNPLFQVLASMLRNVPAGDLAARRDLPWSASTRVDGESAKFDLSLSVIESERDGCRRVRAMYADRSVRSRDDRADDGPFARRCCDGIVADPAQPISRLPLLDAGRAPGSWSSSGTRRRSTTPRDAACTSSSRSRSSARRDAVAVDVRRSGS